MTSDHERPSVHHSKVRLRLGVLALPLILLAPIAGQTTASASRPTPYYLALGDSLAQGVQPNASGVSVETNHGYVDDLYAVESTRVPGLQLEKLGCPGETTTTMINGGICAYSKSKKHNSQLYQAEHFLKSHTVAFVTIDIGANNVDGCAPGFDPTCISAGFAAATTDLPTILSSLQAAAPGVPIFAMNYYDPFLAAWLQATPGLAIAIASEDLADKFNGLLGSIYSAFSVPVADVAGTFQTDDFTDIVTIPIFGSVPLNVGLICSWTWMCVLPPQLPNIHANDLGYEVIAGTFEPLIP
jgi:lysophospholipase L1-like esterase